MLTTSKFYEMDKTTLCPICGKNATRDATPFCSKRCADIDLGKWFLGSYSVPVVEEDESVPDDDDLEQGQMH